MARRPVPDPARLRGGLTRRRRPPRQAQAAARAVEGRRVVLRALSLGESGGLVRARLPRRPRARRRGLPGVPARFRRGRRNLDAEGARTRVHRRGASRRRARPGAGRRLLRAPARVSAQRRARQRGRLPGAAPPRRRSASGQVREHARVRAVHKRSGRVRARPGTDGDRQAGSRLRRRGQHRRDRASSGGIRAGCRLHGHRSDRAAAEGAAPPDSAPLACVRRRRGGPVGDAARHGARGCERVRRAVSSRCLRESIRPTILRGSRRSSARPSRTFSTGRRSRRSGQTIARQAVARSRHFSRAFPTRSTGRTLGAGPTTISACRSGSAAVGHAPLRRGRPSASVRRATRSSAGRLPE